MQYNGVILETNGAMHFLNYDKNAISYKQADTTLQNWWIVVWNKMPWIIDNEGIHNFHELHHSFPDPEVILHSIYDLQFINFQTIEEQTYV